MSNPIEEAIALLQRKLKEQEREVSKTKETINRLCEAAGKPAIYADTDVSAGVVMAVTRADQFYGQPLATAVRQILEMRHAAGTGPATVKEIYETLKQGGYSFETKNDLNAMRGLRVSLTKNVALFHKLPNGQFGLVAWYPKIQARNKHAASVIEDEDEDEKDLEAANPETNESAEKA
jgi:hypothetical protein